MTLGRLIQVRGWLAFVLAVVYTVAGAIGVFADFDDTSDVVIWLVLLWGGAALLIACIFLVAAESTLSAALMSLGAAAGGLALFWTLVIPVAVAAIVAMSFAIARRPPNPA